MTIPATDAERLAAIHRRESRSLLQYVREASLYAGRDKDTLAAIHRIAQESATLSESVLDYLEKIRIAPADPGSFAMNFTDLNFTAVRSVLPKLVDEQRREVAALEGESFAGEDAKQVLAGLLESNRKHLRELEALGAG